MSRGVRTGGIMDKNEVKKASIIELAELYSNKSLGTVLTCILDRQRSRRRPHRYRVIGRIAFRRTAHIGARRDEEAEVLHPNGVETIIAELLRLGLIDRWGTATLAARLASSSLVTPR